MDFTKIKCISEQCKDHNIIMGGAGGSFGGRITIAKVRCPECGLTLMIVPMSKEYEYGISATTAEERADERIKKAKEKSELELARTINQIRESVGLGQFTQSQIEEALGFYNDDAPASYVKRCFIKDLKMIKDRQS